MTPFQTPGPFYPVDRNHEIRTDLVAEGVEGRVVRVRGRVLDESGSPLAGAVVEIWQACASGRYNHDEDPNPTWLDPEFGYWGRAVTSAEGRYTFRTIIPGAYPAEPGWLRPPHIHFRVSLEGFETVNTQMYFAGHPLNVFDRILHELSRAERGKLVVEFREGGGGLEGEFDLELARARGIGPL